MEVCSYLKPCPSSKELTLRASPITCPFFKLFIITSTCSVWNSTTTSLSVRFGVIWSPRHFTGQYRIPGNILYSFRLTIFCSSAKHECRKPKPGTPLAGSSVRSPWRVSHDSRCQASCHEHYASFSGSCDGLGSADNLLAGEASSSSAAPGTLATLTGSFARCHPPVFTTLLIVYW